MTETQQVIPVAVALIQQGNTIFMQQRNDGRVYDGYWEFPGGKIETGESPSQALCREVMEETGLRITSMAPWLVRRHRYPHGEVELHFFRVSQWTGEAQGREGQSYRWQSLTGVLPTPFLPANELIWKWLQLPSICAITDVRTQEEASLLAKLPEVIRQGATLIQLRDKHLSDENRKTLAEKIAKITKAQQALLVINDDPHLAKAVGADGIHFSSQQLLRETQRPPSFQWVGASCHNPQELQHAQQLGLDYVVLSPVMKTLTHVNEPPLGWDAFSHFRQNVGLPVYALGGLSPTDLPMALSHGAQGVAMMRKVWEISSPLSSNTL